MPGDPVLSKNLSEILFSVFKPFSAFLSKNSPEKTRLETCFELRNKKNLSVKPVFL